MATRVTVKRREDESREAADRRGQRTMEKLGEILEDVERGMDDRTAHILDQLVETELEESAAFGPETVNGEWVEKAAEKAARIAAIPERFAASSVLAEGFAP